MNPLCAKKLKTNYNVTPYGNRGTERVNLLDSLYLQCVVPAIYHTPSKAIC
jgi:hypothetical protein